MQIFSDRVDRLILTAEQILQDNSSSTAKTLWLEEARSSEVLAPLRNRLLDWLWSDRNVRPILSTLRLLNDERLVHILIEQLSRSGRQCRSWMPTNFEDRKRQLSLVALTHIAYAEANEFLTGIAPKGMIYIPPGEFIMGNDKNPRPDETPVHQVWLCGFYIRRHTSTMAEYRNFLLDGGYERQSLWTSTGWKWRRQYADIAEARWQMLTRVPSDDYSVPWTNWYEAMAFARWSGASLPTEAQWEKAARGNDGRIFPWGNDFDENLCSTDALDLEGPTRPGYYSPQGDSPYGVADMAGNLLEWVTSLYMPYPYREDDGREAPEAPGKRVHRGGAWSNPPFVATTYCRVPNDPYEIHIDHGVRLVLTPRHIYIGG